ncbi:MAG TPA: hypothetical protein VMD76_03645 [Candidatus Sulfotelmatobacter sp.]|nr:hypothetical protein [Candidatus Sulfotelmatobacter sp.]
MTSTGFGWSEFYLICFAVGFLFSFISFVFGSARFGRLHMPHLHGHAMPNVGAGHGLPGHATPGHAPAATGSHAAGAQQRAEVSVSPFNPPTIAAFLAWFGGTGYLLTRYSALRVSVELLMSIAVGLIGGAIVFVFLTRVLMSDEENMDPADYEMVGVLGRLCVPIREGGTGEIIYSQAGTRRVCGARSDQGNPIAKGAEVIVTRYEKGIAYVRLWSEMSGEEDEAAASGSKQQ